MILDFARPGETLSDAGFRKRLERYYEWLRLGVTQREALGRALDEIDARGVELARGPIAA